MIADLIDLNGDLFGRFKDGATSFRIRLGDYSAIVYAYCLGIRVARRILGTLGVGRYRPAITLYSGAT